MDIGGYVGKAILVDLNRREGIIEYLNEKIIRKFIGGIGMNTYYLFRELQEEVDPLSPENVICIGIGPLVGSRLPGTDRVEITSKSPLSGGFASANAGEHLGLGFKKAGFDQIIIKGRSEKPIIIFFHDDSFEILPAENLWGLDNFDTVKKIKESLEDENLHVLTIGPAGENLVRFANIQSDCYMSFSRGGLGAVLGSKNIKAIVVPGGDYNAPVSYPDLLKCLKKDVVSRIQNDPLYKATCKYGTMVFISKEVSLGDKLSAEYFFENHKQKALGCYSCPMPCSHLVKIKEGPLKGKEFRGGEVSPARAFAGPCNITDFNSVLTCSEISAKYGLEMLSVGGVIGWLMDCFEKGLVSKEDTDGLDVRSGDSDVVCTLLKKIAFREGIGDPLAEGVFRASHLIGRGTEYLQLSVKKVEFQVDPRPARPGIAWGFAQAVSSRSDAAKTHPLLEFTDSLPPETFKHLLGMEKTAGNMEKIIEWMALSEEEKEEMLGNPPAIVWKTYFGKAKTVHWAEGLSAIIDSLGICKRYSMDLCVALGYEHYSQMIKAVTGLDISIKDLKEIGERIYTLQRVFNFKEINASRKDDTFPEIVFEEPLKMKYRYPKDKFELLLDEYYECHGWNKKTGLPTIERIIDLDLYEETKKCHSIFLS
ncbi:MAG: aldehyde ferredoxin oxidoreductase C-terminal domain-containing protein [Caldisericia bacterium]|nr:aldehyde ferredoxin oxidoreductase C-terminal domain-containing protein [Caldisericia bacterium]